MKFTSTVVLASLFGMLAGAQPIVDRRGLNVANPNYVVETAYATVTAQAAVPEANVVVVTVTDTVVAGQKPVQSPAPPMGHNAAQSSEQSSSQQAVSRQPSAPAPSTSSTPVATPIPEPTTAAQTTAAQTTSAPAATSAPEASDWKQEMLSQLNAIRAAAGKSPVSLNQDMNSIAQAHSNYMSRIRSMTHSDASGSLGTRLSAQGINWESAAENIAWNQKTVSEVMTAWKNSPGHYANIVGDYNYVGFGVTDLYWTQDFLKA
ncbi:hypothetical protein LPJ79_001156 [Coemansia sp. RSA 1821]|nr:hypothetical protein LPJ79_001156 [Coemansia sp. RSA 1821]KAJ2648676.1 hypothetical protein IWW40_003740 [Coemansia sp. RSA 1250]